MRTGDGRIAIVGAGFSGAALAIQLLQRGAADVTLIERSGRFGPGLAYGTTCDRHLLNVRSGRMSLFPERPRDFVRWLDGEGLDADPEGFARRRDYGRYVQACLAQAQAGAPGRLTLVTGEVERLGLGADRAEVRLSGGQVLQAAAVVLANGNAPPAELPLAGTAGLGARCIGDPWAPEALDTVGPDEDLILVGTGLTAVDVLLALEAGGWRGRALALSRRGLLPRTHAEQGERGEGPPPTGAMSRRLREVRRRARDSSWTDVMDELRPHGQAMWRDTAPVERARFLRHLRPWWDVHRHRMAPEIGAAVDRLIGEGRLKLAAGRLLRVEPHDEGLAVEWRPRGGGDPQTTGAARLINCTGPQGDPSRADEPVMRELLAAGAARTDPLRLGLDVDPAGRVLDAEGRPQERLWAMGPLSRGALWEIVAVPEIRQQAVDLADRLAPSAAAGTKPRRIARHLDDVGESYGEHFAVAAVFGARLIGAGAACMVHAVAPWLFTQTASRTVRKLHAQLTARTSRPE